MANRCAGLDPTWAHRPTPAPAHAAGGHYHCCSSSPAWRLTPGAAFENEALTSALRASMAPAHASAAAWSFSSPPATPSSSTTSSASELRSSSSGHDAAPPSAPAASSTSSRPGQLPARALAAGPRAGRVTKRKPRPSRRPPTTYITADPANFRRMVQEITGLPVPVVPGRSEAAAAVAATNWTPAPACVLPTLDTSAFLLDRAELGSVPAPEDKTPGVGHASTVTNDAAAAAAAVAGAAGDNDASALLELEALVCAAAGDSECGFFPTLDLESCWGII